MSGRQRVAVVTGASRGLGNVIARVLAVQGYDLVIGGREKSALKDAAKPLRELGRRVVTVDGDISDTAVCTWLADEARQLGGLQVLVNNASELGGVKPLAGTDPLLAEHIFRVNVVAPIVLMTAA